MMKTASFVLVATLMAAPAFAQTASTPSDAAAASGNNNQAVATTSANAPQPAHGSNSFSQGEARRRIESHGIKKVTGLHKDKDGVWRGTGMLNNASVPVWLDYKGNVSPAGTTSATNTSNRNVDGTTGNPPGTAAGRAMDRTLGTNTTGTNPAANQPDGTPGNPPGTAAGRAMDRTLGTNTTGANPNGTTKP